MPRAKTSTKNQEKLRVVKRHRVHFLDKKIIENNNGPNQTPYLKGIQEGAVYANLDEIEAGRLYTVCELSNEMIVLNEPTTLERLQFLGQLAQTTGLTVAEVKEELGIE